MYNSDIDTTQKMRQLEKELKKLYGDAYARLTAESEKYFDEFEERYEKQYEAYRQGKYTKQEFDAWYLNQVARGERWEALRDDMARKVTNANVEAAKLINATTPEVFRTNYNWSAYEAEKASGIAFNVYSESAVQQLMQDNPNLLPPKKINVTKDVAWNKKKLSNAVASGILTGKGIDQISKSFGQVTDMNWAAAVRNARTAVTSAQNAGRQQNMEDIEEFAEANGLKLQKEWVSANDGRVRDSHAELNGVRVDIDEKFPNGLMYPADPNGAPAEVYNCRCAQCTVIDGKMARRTDKTKATYQKWQEERLAIQEENRIERKARSGLASPVTVDNIHNATRNTAITEEATNEIAKVMGNKGMLYLYDNVEVVSLGNTKEILRTNAEQYGTFAKYTLQINQSAIGGMTVAEIDSIFINSTNTVCNSLEDALEHEKYHAKLCNIVGYSAYSRMAETDGIAGVSPYAMRDLTETISEVGTLKAQGRYDKISVEAKELFEKYFPEV